MKKPITIVALVLAATAGHARADGLSSIAVAGDADDPESAKLFASQGGATAGAARTAAVAFAGSDGNPCEPHWDLTIGQPGVAGDPFPHPQIRAITEYNGEIIAGGANFDTIGGVSANNIARWDGAAWHPLGSGVSGPQGNEGVVTLTVFDGDLIVGGTFLSAGDVPGTAYIARWDGNDWGPVGGGVDWTVESLAVFDDGSGPALYAGGWFETAEGQTVNHIAKWDGDEWSALGTGVGDGPFPVASVVDMTVFDDGSGPALYIVGSFGSADGVPGTGKIARWDGNEFTALGTGAGGGDLYGVASVDAGEPGGPALYVGGFISSIDSMSVAHVAKWDGSQWMPMAQSMNGHVRELAIFDDGGGEGPAPYMVGWFTAVDGQPVDRVARWNDDTETWEQVGPGTNLDAWAVHVSDAAPGSGLPTLFVGGLFTAVGDMQANRIAAWTGCADPDAAIPGDLNGDGVVNVLDLLILLEAWGDCDDPDDCPADLNDDGAVNVLDLLILLENWG